MVNAGPAPVGAVVTVLLVCNLQSVSVAVTNVPTGNVMPAGGVAVAVFMTFWAATGPNNSALVAKAIATFLSLEIKFSGATTLRPSQENASTTLVVNDLGCRMYLKLFISEIHMSISGHIATSSSNCLINMTEISNSCCS